MSSVDIENNITLNKPDEIAVGFNKFLQIFQAPVSLETNFLEIEFLHDTDPVFLTKPVDKID